MSQLTIPRTAAYDDEAVCDTKDVTRDALASNQKQCQTVRQENRLFCDGIFIVIKKNGAIEWITVCFMCCS
jgi:hypothetical protein